MPDEESLKAGSISRQDPSLKITPIIIANNNIPPTLKRHCFKYCTHINSFNPHSHPW